MKKLALNVDSLQVQSFETASERVEEVGTVRGFAKPTGLNDTNCSAIDACASALGCTYFDCPTVDPATCESADDACPSGRGCTSVSPC